MSSKKKSSAVANVSTAPAAPFKKVIWIGQSQDEIPSDYELRKQIGDDLVRAQHGGKPHDGRPYKGLDKTREIRVGVHAAGNHRIIYRATDTAVVVLAGYPKQNDKVSRQQQNLIKVRDSQARKLGH